MNHLNTFGYVSFLVHICVYLCIVLRCVLVCVLLFLLVCVSVCRLTFRHSNVRVFARVSVHVDNIMVCVC